MLDCIVPISDHQAISLKLQITNKRGLGFWQFNIMYLKDHDYIHLIKYTIYNCKRNYINESNTTLCELCKIEIKDASIKYAKHKSNYKRGRIETLESKLKYL